MTKIKRRLKRTNKVIRYIYYFISILYTITLLFFIKSLLSLTGIETIIRIIVIVLFVLFLGYYLLSGLLNLLQKKYKGILITSFISLIFILIFSFGSYYINFIYKNLDNMTEDGNLLYKTYLITLSDTSLDSKDIIGIISEDVEKYNYDLANTLYKNEKLSNETKKYDDYIKMLEDLYNGDIKGAFVPGNYITLFQNEEGFENISDNTKVIYSYTEKKKNEDLIFTSNKDFKEPLTFLLMGVDSETNGLKETSAFNGDTLMAVTFNPNTLNTVMVSIPRDTYVPISCKNNAYSKINSAAAYGTSCVINTVSNFLDIDIDYYLKINFKGVVELVDALGGVEVDVEKPYFNSWGGVNYHGKMCEQNSDRLYGKNTVCVDPGLQTLNGEQALAYARNRHLYIGGDLDRIRHQQQVVEAIANKVMHFDSIKDFQKILNVVSNNISTNMDTNTILSGYQVIKNMVGNVLAGEDLITINKAYLETYPLNVYVPSQGRNTSAQGYFENSLKDIKKALNVSLDKEKEEIIKTFSFSVNKPFEIHSPGKGIRTGQSGALLPSFVGKTLTEAEKFCNDNGITLHKEYVDSGSHYNPNVAVGLIGDQSIHKDVLLSTVDDLTVYIVNSRAATSEEPDDDNKNQKPNDSNKDDKLDKDQKDDEQKEDEEDKKADITEVIPGLN